MILNGISKIKPEAGDFIVLVDYGSEGLSVLCQAETLADAVRLALGDPRGEAMSVVKLIRVETEENDDEK